MTLKFASRALDKFVVRLPEGMRSKLAVMAKANNRTMNAEIVARLEASFGVNDDAVTLHTADGALVSRMARTLEELSKQVAEIQLRLRSEKDRR